MAVVRAYRNITSDELRWHDKNDLPTVQDWLFWEGSFDEIPYVGMTICGTKTEMSKEGLAIDFDIRQKDGKHYHSLITIPEEMFTPAPFGGTWGDKGIMAGRLGPDGLPTGYDLKFTVGNISIDLTSRALVGGMKFSDARPGYSSHHPDKGIAAGWWPLVARSECEGTITIDGKGVKVKGWSYLERQCIATGTNKPNWGDTDAPSTQSVWSWGHFVAGEYTAAWTDSAASRHLGYQHYGPLVLWRGNKPLLCTLNCSVSVEQYVINADDGCPQNYISTLRAADDHTELFVVLNNGLLVHRSTRNVYYTRQLSSINVRVKDVRLNETEKVTGSAIHEWGMNKGYIPPWSAKNK